MFGVWRALCSEPLTSFCSFSKCADGLICLSIFSSSSAARRVPHQEANADVVTDNTPGITTRHLLARGQHVLFHLSVKWQLSASEICPTPLALVVSFYDDVVERD
ncbi:uncharacterized protein BDZ99DRAFT_134359 [Mytilinidion resinicola]|uniref:Uncharacterized protein n=1 Tax=Mytilinidion resinicola TaxID=574789 RepID=A0A6A6Z7Q8_9PEZI|nr:uncharacterized protein BDZ99DRAFT_134359 [Mytilinidion resinicola]KAF2816354.1 hypothetical protein BDZ99DRAFT_134359 [Mytilinidion resinicola]